MTRQEEEKGVFCYIEKQKRLPFVVVVGSFLVLVLHSYLDLMFMCAAFFNNVSVYSGDVICIYLSVHVPQPSNTYSKPGMQ